MSFMSTRWMIDMNLDEPSYVFTTSKHMISIALSMREEEHFLSNEYCYIDGKWNRCKDFPYCHLECLSSCVTKASTSFHNGVLRRNSRVLHQVFLSHQRSHGESGPRQSFWSDCWVRANEAWGIQEGMTKVYANSVLEKLKTGEFHLLQCGNRQQARLRREKAKELLSEDFFMCKPWVPIMMLSKSWRNLSQRNPPKINGAFLFPGWNGGTTADHAFFLLLHGRMRQPQISLR